MSQRSNAPVYALFGAFLFVACLGCVLFLVIEKPWESEPEPEPIVDAGPPPFDAGHDAGVDAGPLILSWRGSLGETAPVAFGGGRYCNYTSLFRDVTLELSSQGADAQGRPVVLGGTATATYVETTRACPLPATPPNQHMLVFASAAYEGDELVVELNGQAGVPATRGTFRGRVGADAIEGTLEITRNEPLAPIALFTMRAPLRLARE
jgi:hypothetical protein